MEVVLKMSRAAVMVAPPELRPPTDKNYPMKMKEENRMSKGKHKKQTRKNNKLSKR
jgi:hypothetical protein